MFAKILIALFGALIGCTSGAPLSDDKIIGGLPTNITQVPWQVALIFKNRQICGGSIISNRWILTGAQCIRGVLDPREYKILVGTEDKKTVNGTMIGVASYAVHESYSGATLDFDYGLLQLKEELIFNERIQPIRLPKIGAEHIATGSNVLVSGWGKLKSNDAAGTRYLHAVKLPTVDHQLCNKVYRGIVTDRMFCAGYFKEGGKNACQGDSGGPAVSFDSEMVPTLVGIVSWGSRECAKPGHPGVFSRVLDAREWIHTKSGV